MTRLRAASATDVGRVRSSNEDLAIVGDWLFAVADGMGGHAGGEVAASVALDALQTSFDEQRSLDALRRAVGQANEAVWQRSQADENLRGMGTTLTAAALLAHADGHDVLGLANVGDSRAYLLSSGKVAQVTKDHSLAEEKVRQGQMSEAEAAVSPHRHILTRALGVSPAVDVDLWELELHAGDRILLCSDGLTNELGDDQIAQVLMSVPEPSDAARVLVDAANRHGGNDNITVVVIEVVDGPGIAGLFADVDADPTEDPTGDPVSPGRGQQVTPGGPPGQDPGEGPPAASAGGAEDAVRLVHAAGTRSDLTQMTPATSSARGSDQPLARASATVALADRPRVPAAPPGGGAPVKQSRRQRRRAMGIPRRITLRVLGFAVLVLAVLAGGYALLRWYATDNWYVTVRGGQLVIYQGRSGGVFWFKPHIVDRTGVMTTQILSDHLSALQTNVEESSLAAAKQYVRNLHQEYESTIAPPPSSSSTTSTPSSSTSVPSSSSSASPPSSTAGASWGLEFGNPAPATLLLALVTPAGDGLMVGLA